MQTVTRFVGGMLFIAIVSTGGNAQDASKSGDIRRVIQREIIFSGSLKDVWNVWTTTEGATTFFAPQAKIELSIGGAYELYFDVDKPYGMKGSEGCKVLSYVPYQMLSFSWNAPIHLANVRKERTWVVIMFEKQGEKATRLKLTHLGWKSGQEWEQAYQYFVKAWDDVLFKLEQRFKSGPIDWKNPPQRSQKK